VARDPAAVASILVPAVRPNLASLTAHLDALGDWSEAALEAHVNAWCEHAGVKLGKVAQPVRVALSGQKTGPGLFQTLSILGRENSLRRLRAALDAIPSAP
jgi:glutamyl-tRNA synthetase